MFVFYNNYRNSKLATVFSAIGGGCYAGALISLVASFSDESMTLQETFFLVILFLVLGWGLNKIADKIANSKVNSQFTANNVTNNMANNATYNAVNNSTNNDANNAVNNTTNNSVNKDTTYNSSNINTYNNVDKENKEIVANRVDAVSKSKETAKEGTISTDEWKCPNCNRINKGNFCSECGTAKVVYKNNFCSKCGTKLEENAKFCSNCGAKV